jgi:hypothetical protein
MAFDERLCYSVRTAFYVIGIIAALCGIALIVVAASGKVHKFTGYLAGTFILMGGLSVVFVGAKNYRGHWSFVTGVALSILGLSALASAYDYDMSRSDFAGELFLGVAFLTFGVLSLYSGHKLHRCTLALEANAAAKPPNGEAICVRCKKTFAVSERIAFQGVHVCAACKPAFVQKLAEGMKTNTHALDGGIVLQFHISHHCLAASDMIL